MNETNQIEFQIQIPAAKEKHITITLIQVGNYTTLYTIVMQI